MTFKWEAGKLIIGVHSWDLMDAAVPKCIEHKMDEEYLDSHDWAIAVVWPFEHTGKLLAEACSKTCFEVDVNEFQQVLTDDQKTIMQEFDKLLRAKDPVMVEDFIEMLPKFNKKEN
jgi:hypothetical protein